jgi:hypothetical protein
LPSDVREALDAYRRGLADQLEATARDRRRPCVYFRSKRIADAPLRRGWLGRVLGGKAAEPKLPSTASKFGGIPYTEGEEDWNGWRFLGQLDLSEAGKLLPRYSLSGLLRIDSSDAPLSEGFRVRWFPEPTESKAHPVEVISVGKWEAAHEFHAG